MKTVKTILALTALASLTACDPGRGRATRDERSDRHYQAAMADYSAGRMDAAADGFGKAVRDNPANASARFQYACLLQDHRQDFLRAWCNYREFVQQQPDGEKAQMAKDRAELCERQVAEILARRHNLADAAALAKANESIRGDYNAAAARCERLEKDLAEARGRCAALESENARLRKMMASTGSGDEAAPSAASGLATARELLEEEDGDRLKLSPDARALFGEAEEDERSALLDAPAADGDGAAPAASASDRPVTKLTEFARQREKQAAEPPHEERPATYVVEEGDTLYKIALRFYGKMSAWAKIREANKATVSTDGRIKTGQTLVLP